MRFTSTLVASVLLASTTLAGPLVARDMDKDDGCSLFRHSSERYEGAICKEEINTSTFPNLMVPDNKSGCVRYFQGIDMTGVVTEVDLYAKDGIESACDCIAACLSRPLSCTNWVYKHTFVPTLDGGKRSCTLYSSPNLPTSVTLAYNLNSSVGFDKLSPQNNPQHGATAAFTFKDMNSTIPDPNGVSGFMTQDPNGKLYC